MASFKYNQGQLEIENGTIDLLTDTIKVMLVTASYVPDKDHLVVDAGGANDPVDHELTVAGYARGWGGAGRKTLGSKTHLANTTNDRAVFDAADVAWTALATGETIAGAIVIKEGAVNDTTSRLIAYVDLTDTPTNGGDITIQWSADGVFYIQN